MDSLFSRATEVIGSTWAVGLFFVWTLAHTIIGREYLSFISELAIFLALIIVRGQNLDATRMHENLEKDMAATRRIENKLS
jgi:hypothetical protein